MTSDLRLDDERTRLLMIAYIDEVNSPAGRIAFAVTDDGRLLRASFREGTYERTLEQEVADEGYRLDRSTARTARAREQLEEYAAGDRQAFDLPVVLAGSPFQQAVWSSLMRIPYGETRTYAQLGQMIGRSGAARAVGRANATNRIPLVIPCHRVIGADGSLTGFAGGTHLKVRLLEHEARVLGRMSPVGTERPQTLRLAI